MTNRYDSLVNFRGEYFETLDSLNLLYSGYWSLEFMEIVPYDTFADSQRLQEREITFDFMKDPVKANPIKMAIWEYQKDPTDSEKEQKMLESYATEKEFICIMLAVTAYTDFTGNFC